MDLIDKIFEYPNHIQESVFFEALLSLYSIEAILSAITETLETQHGDPIDYVCLFIRDAILLAPEPFKSDFAAQFHQSSVIPHLEQTLFFQDFNNRSNALYTLAKVGSSNSIGALHKAFEQFVDSDPFMLPHLLFELRWLGDTNTAPLMDRIALDSHYLVRWSLLSILDQAYCESDKDCPELAYLQTLCKDTNQWVQAEAIYVRHDLEETTRIRRLPSTERKMQHKALKSTLKILRPKFTFSDLEVRFWNHLAQQQQRTFSLEYLEQFVNTLIH